MHPFCDKCVGLPSVPGEMDQENSDHRGEHCSATSYAAGVLSYFVIFPSNLAEGIRTRSLVNPLNLHSI